MLILDTLLACGQAIGRLLMTVLYGLLYLGAALISVLWDGFEELRESR